MKNKEDTLHLLSECSAGISMAIDSLNEVLPSVKSAEMKERITKSIDEHKKLDIEVDHEIGKWGGTPKEPNFMAKSMSWLRTNMQLAINDSDATTADILTDGCNNGIKMLTKYKNQYNTADPTALRLTDQLIDSEQRLTKELKAYL